MSSGLFSNITVSMSQDPAAFRRDLPLLVGQALFRGGSIPWWRKYLPLHFEEFSGAKYGMDRRGPGYQAYKKKKYGHKKYLTWSGALQREVTTRFPREMPTRGKTTVSKTMTMSARVLNLSNARGGELPDYRDEVTTTIESEKNWMATVISARLLRDVRAYKRTKVKQL